MKIRRYLDRKGITASDSDIALKFGLDRLRAKDRPLTVPMKQLSNTNPASNGKTAPLSGMT